MERSLVPASAPVGDAPVVQLLAYLFEAAAPQRLLEYLPDHGGCGRVDLQRGTLLPPVVHLDSLVAEGSVGGEEEAPRCRFSHPPDDLLRKIFAVELIHALDDSLKQSAGGVVLRLLGDGHHPDTLPPQHRLEGDGVFALSGEAAEFPDENHVEGGLGLATLLDHLPELRSVCDEAALGLVHVLSGDGVAVGPGVVLERSELGGHGQVHVLPVAGYPGVERRRCERL